MPTPSQKPLPMNGERCWLSVVLPLVGTVAALLIMCWLTRDFAYMAKRQKCLADHPGDFGGCHLAGTLAEGALWKATVIMLMTVGLFAMVFLLNRWGSRSFRTPVMRIAWLILAVVAATMFIYWVIAMFEAGAGSL